MFRLFQQPDPFFPKTCFDPFKVVKLDCRDLAFLMTMMESVSRIVTQHTPIIAGVDRRIDIRQVIPRHSALIVNPYFPAQDSATFGL